MSAPLPPELAGRFVRRRDDRRSALVRRDFADAFDELGLLEAADLEPAALVEEARCAGLEGARLAGGASGRGTIAVLPAGGLGRAGVRPYRRGGLARRVSRRRYLWGRRAERELLVTERLRARGVPVVEPLAAVRSDLGAGYRATIVTLWEEEVRPAGAALHGLPPDEAAPILRAVGRTAARLHAAGGWHADLHVDNLLVREARSAGPEGAGPEGLEAGEPGGVGTPGPDGADDEPLPLLVDLDRGRTFPFPIPASVGRWSLRRLARHLRKHGLGGAAAAMYALRDEYDRERERLRDRGGWRRVTDFDKD